MVSSDFTMLHDMRHIRAFLRVAQTRNFTRAAEALHVSQSALTVQIQQLEEGLGVLLFDRNKRSVSLTDAGADVIGPLQRLLDDAEDIVRHARDLSCARTGTVTLAALPTVAAEVLPLVLKSFAAHYPAVRVSVVDVVAETVRELVAKRQVDFGIATRHGATDDLKATPLFRDQLVLFVPAGHVLAARAVVTLREANEHELILPRRDSSVRESVEDLARKEGIVLQTRHETNFMPTALGLVRGGLGVTILPETAAGADSVGLVRISMGKNAVVRHIDLLQRVNRQPSPAADAFIKVLRTHFPQARRRAAQPS